MVDDDKIVKKSFIGAHEDLISLTYIPGRYPSQGAQWYLDRGQEIPDFLLPGRLMMKLQENRPREFETLTSANWQNVSPWWIKIMCGK